MSLTALHSGPSISSLSVSPPLFGGRDTKRGAYPCKAHFSSLCTGNWCHSWATFSPFSRARAATVPSDICVLQAQGLLCPSLVKAMCLGRLRWPEHTQLSPSAPAPVGRGSNQPRCSQRIHRHILAGGPVLSPGQCKLPTVTNFTV